jgi:hypothetical protein
MKVLTTEQAQALYDAMCSLNDASVDATFVFFLRNEHGNITVRSTQGGWGVAVLLGDAIMCEFDNQGEFLQYHGGSV